MIPFCLSAFTSSHDTEMLVESIVCPVTFCGAPSGSDKQVESLCYCLVNKASLILVVPAYSSTVQGVWITGCHTKQLGLLKPCFNSLFMACWSLTGLRNL